MCDDAGVRAAAFMQQQAWLFPPMKPLVIVLKALLCSRDLNNTANGGLSSYSLTNMVVAHLMEEARAEGQQPTGNLLAPCDLGELLYSFLLRFGREFDYRRDAVSVRSGGLVAKRGLGFIRDPEAPVRLSVDCPIAGAEAGDVGSGVIWRVWPGMEGAAALEGAARGLGVPPRLGFPSGAESGAWSHRHIEARWPPFARAPSLPCCLQAVT